MKKTLALMMIVILSPAIVVLLVSTIYNKVIDVGDSKTPRHAELVLVPGGTFPQSDGKETFVHQISAFQIGKYEVTYELWYMVRQWAMQKGFIFENAGRQGGSVDGGEKMSSERLRPVTDIHWRDAMVWCNAYSLINGLTPVYYGDPEFKNVIVSSSSPIVVGVVDNTKGSLDNPYVKWDADGFRLPTEGEWQYAASYIDGKYCTPDYCASGSSEDVSDIKATGLVSWNANNSSNVTHRVGRKLPNALGIFDMSGNTWEWCWDWAGKYPDKSVNYRGPDDGLYRIIRGGSFFKKPEKMNIGLRVMNVPPFYFSDDIGLRVVRSIQLKKQKGSVRHQ